MFLGKLSKRKRCEAFVKYFSYMMNVSRREHLPAVLAVAARIEMRAIVGPTFQKRIVAMIEEHIAARDRGTTCRRRNPPVEVHA